MEVVRFVGVKHAPLGRGHTARSLYTMALRPVGGERAVFLDCPPPPRYPFWLQVRCMQGRKQVE